MQNISKYNPKRIKQTDFNMFHWPYFLMVFITETALFVRCRMAIGHLMRGRVSIGVPMGYVNTPPMTHGHERGRHYVWAWLLERSHM